jgi:cell division protein FtsI/penicillin-binding protein 2
MKKRIVIVFLILLSLFVGVAGRLAYLAGGAEIAQYASVTGSRVISVGINAARGVIYDRNGRPLAGAEEKRAVLCEPMSLSEASAESLREHAVEITAQELDQKISSGYPFFTYVDEPTGGVGLTGLTALARYGGLAQNLIGYIDADGHGVVGIEAAMEEYLYAKGYSYSALFTADAARRALAGYGLAFEGSARPVTQGVSLSLDREIQQICEEVANERVERGVILVSDLQTGQICAWVSRPTYDPNNIAQSLTSGDAMLNKVLYSYCCGSVFKIIVTAAALENGVELLQEYECTGHFQAGEQAIACAKREGHGVIDA